MIQKIRQIVLIIALALVAVTYTAPAQAAQYRFTTSELDSIYAPIALYPDSLLGNILVASSYPEQITEANEWLKENSSVKEEELATIDSIRSWDDSIKSLLVTPDVIGMLADDMNWTQGIYESFCNQTNDVYDTIQKLRSIAFKNGSLASSSQVQVVNDGGQIVIGSTSPEVIVVPQYDSSRVYGWDSTDYLMASLVTWGIFTAIDDYNYGSCFDWRRNRFWYGPGYGYYGYWDGGWRSWDYDRHRPHRPHHNNHHHHHNVPPPPPPHDMPQPYRPVSTSRPHDYYSNVNNGTRPYRGRPVRTYSTNSSGTYRDYTRHTGSSSSSRATRSYGIPTSSSGSIYDRSYTPRGSRATATTTTRSYSTPRGNSTSTSTTRYSRPASTRYSSTKPSYNSDSGSSSGRGTRSYSTPSYNSSSSSSSSRSTRSYTTPSSSSSSSSGRSTRSYSTPSYNSSSSSSSGRSTRSYTTPSYNSSSSSSSGRSTRSYTTPSYNSSSSSGRSSRSYTTPSYNSSSSSGSSSGRSSRSYTTPSYNSSSSSGSSSSRSTRSYTTPSYNSSSSSGSSSSRSSRSRR